MNNSKFIVVKDETTASKLIANGFQVVSQVNGVYTFINQVPKHFNFNEIDVKKMVYSNVITI